MRVLVTGAEGFLGRNLRVRLTELGGHEVLPIGRGASEEALREAAAAADCVVHLAGVNRPPDPADYAAGNTGNASQLYPFEVDSSLGGGGGSPLPLWAIIAAAAGGAAPDAQR